MNNKRQAYALYRSKKYATWQPCKVIIPAGVENVREYVKNDLENQGLIVREVTIQKVVRHD